MAQVVASLESILASQEKTSNLLPIVDMKVSGKKIPRLFFKSRWENSVEGTNLKSLNKYLCTLEGENQILRRFDFDTISVATDNFSVANRVSDGYNGYMYKGKLRNGQDIAICGPSSDNHTHQEYMNEVSILLQLEHENLIQLLGYCIEGTRVYLIYDYAPYATLLTLLFDPGSALLGWAERYKILLGVARVLVYLHTHALNQIIYLDVNPSNILLDERMNPKLWNFGIARSYTKPEDQIYRTSRIIGTYGYMAPEYCLNGHVSAKTDVYRFGMVVLETLSGHSARESIPGTNKLLLEFVWINWAEGTYSNIVDPRIKVNADFTLMKRVIHIGLLCIQYDAKERPTMEEVVGMLLGTSSIDLPVPKQPMAYRNFDEGEDIYSSDDISLNSGNNLDDGKEDIFPGDDAHYLTDEEFEGR